MQLLFAVINHEELVDDILAGFIELGITGATIVESKGMGRLLSREVPIFAGLRALAASSRPANRTIFCLADDEKIDAAIALIQEICGSLDAPGAGIVFTVPVGRVVGLKAEVSVLRLVTGTRLVVGQDVSVCPGDLLVSRAIIA